MTSQITKFIGSPLDFINASKIGLVFVEEELVESRIPEYRRDYGGFLSYNDISFIGIPRENDEFVLQIDKHFRFNHVVMYNGIGNPLGFTNINETIYTEKYKIITLKIIFNFDLVTNIIEIELDIINYVPHEDEGTIHYEKLSSPERRSSRAVDMMELFDAVPNKSPYTNNIFSLLRDPELTYRYSGNLSKGFKKMVSNEWIIDSGDLKGIVDFFDIEDQQVLICKNSNHLTFYTIGEEPVTRNLKFSPELIGNNFITCKKDDRINLYSTRDIFKEDYQNCIAVLDETDRVVIDPIEKDIMIYSYILGATLPTRSEKLTKIFDDLGIKYDLGNLDLDVDPSSDIHFELMYATNGLLVWYDYDNNIHETKLKTFYKKDPYVIQGEIYDAIFLTKDLFIHKLKIDDASKNNYTYTYEITQDPKTDEKEMTFVGTQYILGSNNKYRRLDKFSKNRIRNVQEVNLLNVSHKGCLWIGEKIFGTGKYKLTRL